jgi:hypothetical protein
MGNVITFGHRNKAFFKNVFTITVDKINDGFGFNPSDFPSDFPSDLRPCRSYIF